MLRISASTANRESDGSIPGFSSSASESARFRNGLTRFDYILLASMWLLTYPVFKLARLPYIFDMAALTKAYLLMPVGAVFFAIILAVLGLPLRVTGAPFVSRLRNCKGMVLVLAPAIVLLAWGLGIGIGMVVFVDALGLAELSQRCGERFGSKLLDLVIPGVYLFAGLVAVFAFNHAIVGIRYGGTEDALFSSLDSLIFHVNVSSIADWGLHHIHPWILKWWDFIYFSIWSRLGATLVLVALLGTRRDAIQFVRNILVCYVLALMIFAMVPAKGPYSTRRTDEVDYPTYLGSYSTQQVLASRVRKLYAHTLSDDVRMVGVGDYYISFPSLHAALPIIALWFLRRWRRIQIIAAFFNCLLIPALVFLGWHYIVDILGGWGIAALSIAVTEWVSRSLELKPANMPEQELAVLHCAAR